LPERVKRQGDQAWSTEQISKILEYTDTTRNKLIVHVLAASGVRPGALTNLRFKDLIDMPHGCKALVCYSSTKWEYTTFIHAEVVKVLEQYKEERIRAGEIITNESFVFLKNYQGLLTKPQGLTDSAIDSIISYIASKASVARTKQGKRYNIAAATGFRKRFNTILKSNPNISYAIAERLMDHRTNLEKHYLVTPRDSLFEEYKKAIPELMIDQKERKIQELEIDKAKAAERETEIAYRDAIIQDLSRRLADVEKILKSDSKN
jgi:integrase/recombinase XerD